MYLNQLTNSTTKNTKIFNIVCFFLLFKIRHKDGYLDGDAKKNPKELFELTDELK